LERSSPVINSRSGKKVGQQDINSKIYEIQRPIDQEYEKRVQQRVVFHKQLPKWNYLIKPA
jgi:hypothetical protein